MTRVMDFFGLKYIVLLNATTGVINNDAIFRCAQSVTYEPGVDQVKNFGGNADAAWMVEDGPADPLVTAEVTEMISGMFTSFENSVTTVGAAEASGDVGAMTNAVGTSIMDVANGISAIAVSNANIANLKYGRYEFRKGTLATDINIHVAGVAEISDSDGLVVSDVDCSTPGTITVAELGIEFTAAGIPVFIDGDAAISDVRPINAGTETIVVGGQSTSDCNNNVVTLRCIQPKQKTGDQYYIDIHKFIAKKGVNWNNTSREFGSFTLEGSPTVDTDNGNRVYTINKIIGVCT